MDMDNNIQKEINSLCENAIDYAKKFDITLDYSRQSVKEVEKILDYYFRDLADRSDNDKPTERQIWSMAMIWGAYIGEVMRREIGQNCGWCYEDVFGDGKILHIRLFNKDSRAFPIDKVYKRFVNGPEDNVWSFFDIILQDMVETENPSEPIIRRLDKAEVEKEPYLVWNAFVDILALENYEELDDVQRIPHLCFWYYTEVENGGHLQYFENRGIKQVNETVAALVMLGASRQAEILSRAAKQYTAKQRSPIQTILQLVNTARKGEFDAFDREFYDCQPQMSELLEMYLKNNMERFIKII